MHVSDTCEASGVHPDTHAAAPWRLASITGGGDVFRGRQIRANPPLRAVVQAVVPSVASATRSAPPGTSAAGCMLPKPIVEGKPKPACEWSQLGGAAAFQSPPLYIVRMPRTVVGRTVDTIFAMPRQCHPFLEEIQRLWTATACVTLKDGRRSHNSHGEFWRPWDIG